MDQAERDAKYSDLEKKIAAVKAVGDKVLRKHVTDMLNSAEVALKAMQEEDRREIISAVGDKFLEIAALMKETSK